MKNFYHLAATAFLAIAAIQSGVAQTNLGSSCGCPSVSSRPTVNMSTLAVSGGAADGDLLTNTVLTCDKMWVLDKKIYVPNGLSLTIQPGTVIKATYSAVPANVAALIVSRGGKIFANGTADCQIVFTAQADPMDGSYAIHNVGQWGGLLLAGQASNNLTLSKNGPFVAGGTSGKLAVADGLGTFEGFASSDFRNQFGVNLTTPQSGYLSTFDDNDNSGILKYVSVRYAGSILAVGGEINGITLGSVGRGTNIDHVEVISSADDNMEFFGGTVNVKNATFMFGNDDGLDWDLGYSGKIQNVFLIKTSQNDTLGTVYGASDNGLEMDSDDQQSGNGSGVAIGTIGVGGYRSHPVIYNVTMIGNNKRAENSDNTGMAAIQAKELTEGEIYNSVFANFAIGLNLWTGNKPGEGARVSTTSSTGQAVIDSYDNWRDNNGTPSLKIKNNTFIGMGIGAPGAATAALTLDVSKSSGSNSYYTNVASHAASARDTTQFYVTDGNVKAASIPGFSYLWDMDGSSNAVSTQYDATPNPALATTTVAPADGFFTPENYRGAFASGAPSWLSGWSYGTLLATTGGLAPCPTDINQDGITNNVDFLLLLGQFNQSCH
jgi:hypothetical protein